jgi:hypothetical protein
MAHNSDKRITVFPGDGETSHLAKTRRPLKAYLKTPSVPASVPSQRAREIEASAKGRPVAASQPLSKSTAGAKINYSTFMEIDQAGFAVMAYDNTKECNIIAIKRLRVTNWRTIRQIQPFTSDHVVSIKQSYMNDSEMVIIYEKMDISLRDMTAVLSEPLKDCHIATICKEVSLSTKAT